MITASITHHHCCCLIICFKLFLLLLACCRSTTPHHLAASSFAEASKASTVVVLLLISTTKISKMGRRRADFRLLRVIVPISTLVRISSWFYHHTKIAEDVIISNLIINLVLRVPCSKFLKVGIIARRGPSACSLPTRIRIYLYGHLFAEVVTKRSRTHCGNRYETLYRVLCNRIR